MIEIALSYVDVVIGGLIVLGLVKFLPTRWFSKEEKYRYESAKRLKARLR